MTAITRHGKFTVGQFVENKIERLPDGTGLHLPVGLYVTRIVSSRYYGRELLDDMDEFDSSPGWESEIEVEERPIDDTPRHKISYPDPRSAFAPWPGTVFRFQGQLFRDCYGNRYYPLGDDSGVRPNVGDPVEIVRREYSDYRTEQTAEGVVVVIDHDLYDQHDQLLCGPSRFRVESAFFGSDFGHHSERAVATSPPILHGRPSAERGRDWVWDSEELTGVSGHYEDSSDQSKHRYTLQLSEFPCPVLTLVRLGDLQ